MKVADFFEHVAVTAASSATIVLLEKTGAKLASIPLRPDTIVLSALITSVGAIAIIFLRRSDRSLKLANEKRANIPWKIFRDKVTKYFREEIITGKIARHVIDDHCKGMWTDLVEAASQPVERRKPRIAASRLGKTIPKM
jgi:hypothetical protein